MDEYIIFEKEIEIDELKEQLRLSSLRENHKSESLAELLDSQMLLREQMEQTNASLKSEKDQLQEMSDSRDEARAYKKEADKLCEEKAAASCSS